jgi:hypothetical protein
MLNKTHAVNFKKTRLVPNNFVSCVFICYYPLATYIAVNYHPLLSDGVCARERMALPELERTQRMLLLTWERNNILLDIGM